MISFLSGFVVGQEDTNIIIDVQGVGYELTATFGAMSKFVINEEEKVTIPTYMAVREDAVSLFGFESNSEKSLFLKLITVSGVGPKLAITILSGLSVDELCLAIATSDVSVLSAVKGLGKKTAEKIIVELREKVGTISSGEGVAKKASVPKESQAVQDSIVALVSLGIKPAEANSLIQEVYKEGMKTEEIITMCLKNLSN